MSFILRSVAHCDICGHEWLTSKVPSHCAKCKSRKWNSQVSVSQNVTDPVLEGWMHKPKRIRGAKNLIVKGSLQEPTEYMKRRTFTLPPAPDKSYSAVHIHADHVEVHNPATCRIYKCGMCKAKGKQ